MTEAEWFACSEPRQLLEFLRGKVSERKLRLFVCACCGRLLRFLDGGVKVLVRMTEQTAGTPEKQGMLRSSWRHHYALRHPADWYTTAAAEAPCLLAFEQATASLAKASKTRQQRELAAQQQLLRCIFGNPFRPVSLDPAWLTPDVVGLAQAACENRPLSDGTLNSDRLAILSDALEEAGCDNADILNHCRQPGVHVRGCWVVDALLARS